MALSLPFLLFGSLCLASERKFDVKDDIFAFPQYDVSFSSAYILRDEAIAKLATTTTREAASPGRTANTDTTYGYEYLVGNGRPYLCAIPQVSLEANETEEDVGQEEHDLVAAADRGWQLLKDMEGQQCLYYTTGWWSYMFCYNSYVKQYHALAMTPQGRQWPPPEDPNTPTFILGTYEHMGGGKKPAIEGSSQQSTGELQTQSETTFLVQQLEGGTPCDLTGKPRRIEVQYHCSPGLPDRIGWIKETATCAYQMVVYTSRLCNDVVFQPPKEAHLHRIECQEIVTEEVAAKWQPPSPEPPQIEDTERQQKRTMIGKVELGGKKLVGGDGKRIERGRIVMTAEERAEVVVMQKNGQIQALSAENLKKLELDPKEVEAFQKEMQKLAGGSDWKIERLGDANGQLSLRGVVDAKKKEAKDGSSVDEDVKDDEGAEGGSEEQFKHEI